MNPEMANLLVSDYGKPLGLAEQMPGKSHVFQRHFEKATVFLDCATFAGSFVLLKE